MLGLGAGLGCWAWVLEKRSAVPGRLVSPSDLDTEGNEGVGKCLDLGI